MFIEPTTITRVLWVHMALNKNCVMYHQHHHHLFLKHPSVPCWARVRCMPNLLSLPTYPWILPIQAGTQAISCHLSHTPQAFLPWLTHLILATTIFLQADNHLSTPLCSKCPHHLNLPCITTSATLWTPRRLQIHTATSVLQQHHTSISPSYTLLSPDYADFQPSALMSQSNKLTHLTLYILPFIWYNAPQTVKDGR